MLAKAGRNFFVEEMIECTLRDFVVCFMLAVILVTSFWYQSWLVVL